MLKQNKPNASFKVADYFTYDVEYKTTNRYGITHSFPLLISTTEFREGMHYANSFYNGSGPCHSSGS
jgi:hypothetical protein